MKQSFDHRNSGLVSQKYISNIKNIIHRLKKTRSVYSVDEKVVQSLKFNLLIAVDTLIMRLLTVNWCFTMRTLLHPAPLSAQLWCASAACAVDSTAKMWMAESVLPCRTDYRTTTFINTPPPPSFSAFCSCNKILLLSFKSVHIKQQICKYAAHWFGRKGPWGIDFTWDNFRYVINIFLLY